MLGKKIGKLIAQEFREIPARAGRCLDPLNKPERKGVTLCLFMSKSCLDIDL